MNMRSNDPIVLALIEPQDEMKSEFGQRLREARRHAKLTQVQLAKLVGMVQASVSDLESCGKGSTYTPAIAEACGVSVQWLAYGKGEMRENEATQPAPKEESAKGHSSQANELALLFDMLTDRVERTVAFNGATEVILKILKARNG